MTSTTPESHLTLHDYLRPAWQRRWAILALVVVVTGAAYAYYHSRAARYSTSTELYVRSSSASIPGSGGGAPNPQAAERGVLDLATLAGSLAVASLAKRELRSPSEPHTLAKEVEAAPVASADFLTITAHGGSAASAAVLANAFAHALIAVQSSATRTQVRAAIAQSERELAAIRGPQGAGQRAPVQGQLQQLRLLLVVPALTIAQVSPARPPEAPDSPRPLRDALFAFGLALLLGIVLAYVLEPRRAIASR
jgi:capsular polysaccharide biosynthesis protein